MRMQKRLVGRWRYKTVKYLTAQMQFLKYSLIWTSSVTLTRKKCHFKCKNEEIKHISKIIVPFSVAISYCNVKSDRIKANLLNLKSYFRAGALSKLLRGRLRYWGGKRYKMTRIFRFLGYISGKIGKILEILGGRSPPPPPLLCRPWGKNMWVC